MILEPSYEHLLTRKDYKDLLDLSFYDVDYFKGDRLITKVTYKNQSHSGFKYFGDLEDHAVHDVTYTVGQKDYYTSFEDWNLHAPEGKTFTK